MSCSDADFTELNVLISQLFIYEGENSVKWAFSLMKSCYVPGRGADDVALECWYNFRKYLETKNGYEFSRLQSGETEDERRHRLIAMLYTRMKGAIKDERRRSKQKKFSIQENVDFEKDWNSLVAEASLLYGECYSNAYLDLLDELESLRKWVVTQCKAPWEIVLAVITVSIDSENTGIQITTIEELRSAVSCFLGREITLHRVRYAREQLEEKAMTMPALRRFFRRKS